MKRVPVILFIAFSLMLSVSGVASAHATVHRTPVVLSIPKAMPASSICVYEGCDGQWPALYTCPQGDTQFYDQPVKDSHGLLIGELFSYASFGGTQGNCRSFWVTVLPRINYSANSVFTITSTERSYDCNNCDYVNSYGNLVAGHYADARMHGYDAVFDGLNMAECFIGGFDFTDTYGAPIHFNVPTICFSQ